MSTPNPSHHQTILQSKYNNYLSFTRTKNSLSLNLNNSGFKIEQMLSKFIQEITNKLHTTSQIQSLTIKFNFRLQVKQTFNKLLLIVKSIKHLKKLCIIFDSAHPSYLKMILKMLEASKNLRSFDLKAFPYDHNEDTNRLLAGFLSKMRLRTPHVQHFSFSYRYHGLKDFEFLPRGASGLKRFNSIALEIPADCFLNLEEHGVEKTLDFSPLQSLWNLNSLCIRFFEKHSIYVIRDKVEQNLLNLKSLKVSLENTLGPLTTDIIALTSKISTTFPKLENIALAVKVQRSLYEQEFRHLTTQLSRKIDKLTSLSFSLYRQTLSPDAISNITSMLSKQHLQTLQALSLHFFMCQDFSNSGMNAMGESIAQNLANLKRFSFQFILSPPHSGFIQQLLNSVISSKDFTDKGLVQLGETLTRGNIFGLEILTLSIDKCPDISNKGVKKFCETVGTIKSLKEGFLSFAECDVTSEVESCGQKNSKVQVRLKDLDEQISNSRGK